MYIDQCRLSIVGSNSFVIAPQLMGETCQLGCPKNVGVCTYNICTPQCLSTCCIVLEVMNNCWRHTIKYKPQLVHVNSYMNKLCKVPDAACIFIM